jgi:two-component system, NarL family, sensor histidine kinase DegS
MRDYKINTVKQLDKIMKATVEKIDENRNTVAKTGKNVRNDCIILEDELGALKIEVMNVIETIEYLEEEQKQIKRDLILIKKNHGDYLHEELKKGYEKVDTIKNELKAKKEHQQILINRRNELEEKINELYGIAEKSDVILTHLNIAYGYLTGDLNKVGLQFDSAEQKQLMSLRIIKVQEDERQRMARDIHDGPAQTMSNILLKAEICEKFIDKDKKKAIEELSGLKSIVRDSIKDLRAIIYNLKPVSLNELGLVPALKKHMEYFKENTKLLVSFKTRGILTDIRQEIALTVFRVIQEAASNIKKHANAQNAVFNIEFLKNEIKLHIYDDGKGFDISQIKKKADDLETGFGLFSMRERIQILNGEFEIDSTPEKGTRINITIPLIHNRGNSNGKDKGYDS